MKISTKGRYALRLMIDLAQHDAGGFIPLRDISRRQEISAKYLEQIVVQLSRAGFVRSIRGAQGGYQLSRPPAEYTVGDILRITERVARSGRVFGERAGRMFARGRLYHIGFLARLI